MGWIEMICGNPVNFAQRKTAAKDQIESGRLTSANTLRELFQTTRGKED